MLWLRRITAGLRALLRKKQIECELDDELCAYVEALIDRKIADGMSRDAAVRAARAELGSAAAVKDHVRAIGWESVAESVWQDARYACRGLQKAPGFTAAAILTLALGIGPNAAATSVISFLWQPLPVTNPGELTVLATVQSRNPRVFQRLAYADYQDYKHTGGAFQDMAAWDLDQVALTGDGRTDRLVVGIVTGNYFAMLGLGPAAGRLIGTADDMAGTPRVVVLGHDYWSRRYGGDLSIVGRQVYVDGRRATVIGIAPKAFQGTFRLVRIDAYLPLRQIVPESRLLNRETLSVRVIGRLRPGLDLGQGQAFLDTEAARLENEYAGTNAGRRVRLYSQRLTLVEPEMGNQALIVMAFVMVVVGAVLGIACANVLGLFLARAVQRHREMALRAALGATRSRLVRTGLAEAVLIGLAGTAVGAAVGFVVARRIVAYAAVPGFPIYLDLALDWRVFGYITLLLAASTLLVGLVPALHASGVDPRAGLTEGRTATLGRTKQRMRSALATAQVAGSVALLVMCGLFVRSVSALEAVHLGYDANQILLAATDPSALGYDEARSRAFYESVTGALETLPGVTRVAQSIFVPFGNSNSTAQINAEGTPRPTNLSGVFADRHTVSSDYFQAMGTAILRGHSFVRTDVAGALPVAVINQAMAARLWPGEDAVGKRFEETPGSSSPVTVIGVVADAWYRREELGGTTRPRYFLSLDQFFEHKRVLHVRLDSARPATPADIQRAIRGIDPAVPIDDVFMLDYQVSFGSAGFGGTRGLAYLTGVLGLLGLLLALVGTYGVLSVFVTERRREIGIRMALGATRTDVLHAVLWQSTALTLTGVVLGLALAAGLASLVRGMFFGVRPIDPATFAAVAVAFVVVVALASLLPARLATQIDPLDALRAE
jgi:predicted permease